MKLRQIWETRSSLIKLLRANIPINLAWRLKPLAFQMSDLEKLHVDLLRKHGTQNGQAIEVLPESQPAFFDEWNALMDETLAVEVRPIRLNELNGVQLSAVDLMNLDWLIKEADAPGEAAEVL